MRAFRAAEQLSAILETAHLPPSARALAECVQTRLAAPVRLAVVGWPGSGKRRLVSGLLGRRVLPDVPDLPPSEIVLGPGEAAEAVDGAGRTRALATDRLAEIDAGALAMLRLGAPLPLLEKVGFLVVPLEGDALQLRAALDWTFRRADMVLWCARRIDGRDRGLWRLIPEPLRDHAYLAITEPMPERPAAADRHHAASHFSETRDLSDGPDAADRVARLRTALLAHVSRARREDLEGALIFLDHHVAAREARGVATFDGPAAQADAPSSAAEVAANLPVAELDGTTSQENTQVPAGASEAGVSAGVGPAMSERIVDLISGKAEALADLCAAPGGAERAAGRALEFCVGTLEECAGLAEAEGGSLAERLVEASDLMLLLQLEGSATALADTLALLLQVRRECEADLCA